ncbi:UNVERIFIED_CONTAM: hypothetical protein NCL1_42726 [Trichonephila clavipes]
MFCVGYKQKLRNLVYQYIVKDPNLRNEIQQRKEPLEYIQKAQINWEHRITKSLNNMSNELGLVFSRKSAKAKLILNGSFASHIIMTCVPMIFASRKSMDSSQDWTHILDLMSAAPYRWIPIATGMEDSKKKKCHFNDQLKKEFQFFISKTPLFSAILAEENFVVQLEAEQL